MRLTLLPAALAALPLVSFTARVLSDLGHLKDDESQVILGAAVVDDIIGLVLLTMVGTLAQAGAGRWTVDDVRAALAARDRARCGPVAPASGLCLVGVDYAQREVGK